MCMFVKFFCYWFSILKIFVNFIMNFWNLKFEFVDNLDGYY